KIISQNICVSIRTNQRCIVMVNVTLWKCWTSKISRKNKTFLQSILGNTLLVLFKYSTFQHAKNSHEIQLPSSPTLNSTATCSIILSTTLRVTVSLLLLSRRPSKKYIVGHH